MRHDTPVSISARLAGWCPRTTQTVLDPSCGMGTLVLSLLKRCPALDLVVCVDIDPSAVHETEKTLRPLLGEALQTLQGDFLELETRDFIDIPEGGFDCVIMNPPFLARRRVELSSAVYDGTGRRFPIEAAFLIRAISFLREGGTLLAIVPGSILVNTGGAEIREYLQRTGAVVAVHELAPNSFPGVDGRVFLLVFHKGARQCTLTIYNHDLQNPEFKELTSEDSAQATRFDYSFFHSREMHRRARSKDFLNWCELGSIAIVSRGRCATPKGKSIAIHSSDFRDGFWWSDRVPAPLVNGDCVSSGDLLVTRVGRTALQSFGVVVGPPAHITDCVVRIRPINSESRDVILFALRSLMRSAVMRDILLRGTGARYFTIRDLKSLAIPIGLGTALQEVFVSYCSALVRQDFSRMMACERIASEFLMG